MRNSDLSQSCAIISAWLATQHLSNTNIYRLMAASLIKALDVLIVFILVIVVAVLVIDIVILKNQNNAADTTTIANTTALFLTTTTESNDTITTTTITTTTTATTTRTMTKITTTESNDMTTTLTIDTTTSTLSSTLEIVSSTSLTASVTSSAIHTTTMTTTKSTTTTATATSTIMMSTTSSSSTTTLTTTTTNLSTTTTSITTTTTTTSTTIRTTKPTTFTSTLMTDCYDWRLNGSTSNGIYRIDPGYGLEPFDVYCDMKTDGGGWTVIQRRVDASLEFCNNTWQQYKNGFNNGLESGNLWLGNDRINVMSQWNVTLRVEINGDRLNNRPNIYLYGKYNFSISDEMNDYTLYISLPIEGNASDADLTYGFIYNNGQPFSTVDKNSSQYGSWCANDVRLGGWWFNSRCTLVALNGEYYYHFRWLNPVTGNYIYPNRSEMKIRRK